MQAYAAAVSGGRGSREKSDRFRRRMEAVLSKAGVAVKRAELVRLCPLRSPQRKWRSNRMSLQRFARQP